jgi:hypothetical protein
VRVPASATADLDKVYAAAGKVLADAKPSGWKLKAFKVLLRPLGRQWPCSHCRRADDQSPRATTETH